MDSLKPFRSLSPLLLSLLLALPLASCRNEEEVSDSEKEQTGSSQQSPLRGFYLLNEGNMGSNKASLDRYTFSDGVYSRNIYAEANPDVPKELGDVGNDMASYGSRLWVVVNCSNKVEVLDLKTARRLGQVDIPNCRHLTFHGGNAYVTSYAGPVEINPEYSQKGFVARIDTLTLRETGRVTTGFQPDGIAVSGGKLYVANSGGYMVPNYENTVTVIDLATFKAERTIEVGINLDCILADSEGKLWITSRGDYYGTPGRMYVYDPRKDAIVKTFETAAGALWLDGDRLYAISRSFSYLAGLSGSEYAVYDTGSMEKVSSNFITDGTEKEIRTPYGVAVDPATKEIYVCDATTYVNPGYLRCYTPEGKLKWKQRTGDIPRALTFY